MYTHTAIYIHTLLYVHTYTQLYTNTQTYIYTHRERHIYTHTLQIMQCKQWIRAAFCLTRSTSVSSPERGLDGGWSWVGPEGS